MITGLMAFVLATSVIGAATALLADRGLRGFGAPTRLVWLTALAFPAILLAAAQAPSVPGVAPVFGGPLQGVISLPPLVVPDGGVGTNRAQAGAFVLWIASGLLFLGVVAIARARLAREAEGWRSRRVLGHDVLVTSGVGPAVTGIVRSRIVIPSWVVALPEPQLGVVLAHEDEHVRARDPMMLAAGVLLVAAASWNPVAWWLLGRLRGAIEIDCDRRVLRRLGDVATYGESLLAVASRVPRRSLALAAFTEPTHTLERRLVAMTARISGRTRVMGGVFVATAVLVAFQACGVERPADGDPMAPERPATTELPAELLSEPTFTPFTVAPEITNREQVIAAMAAEYPPLLREAGVGGTVRVYFLITESGAVAETRVDESSGHEALDQAALAVADVYRFTPALMGDEPVPVWVSLPITFRVR